MEVIVNILKNYKKHPILATIIVLAIVGLLIYGLVTAGKNESGNSGDSGSTLTIVPAQTGTATPTVAPATPTESLATPTAAEPTKASTATPTPAGITPTKAAATNTPAPTAKPTATPTQKPATPTPTVKPATPTPTPKPATPTPTPKPAIDEDGWYYDKDNVALYIHTYGHLPGNYITKKDAEALGWTGGSVDRYARGMAIGGDSFGNYEGLLPKKNGRKYYECDIDTKGKSRGSKRIIFSNDGLIFYTDDHYESFTQLY